MTLQDRLRDGIARAASGNSALWSSIMAESAAALDAKDAEIARLIEIIQEAYETDHSGSFNGWLDMNGYRLNGSPTTEEGQ